MKKLLWWLNIAVALAMVLAYLSTFISPLKFRLLPLFGLSYIIWFFLNVSYAVFWLFIKKKKNALLSILILLIGWNIHSSNYRWFGSYTEEATDLKIMSYNVRSFDRYHFLDGEQTKNAIFKIIEEENADVMCFQEFYYSTASGDINTRDTLIQISSAPYYQEKYTHHMRGGRHFGICTLSKHKIINQGEIAFDNDDNNYCIFSDIVVKKDTIRIFNAHLASIRFEKEDYDFLDQDQKKTTQNGGFFSNTKRIVSRLLLAYEKRTTQSEKVLIEVRKSPFPVILCGDFNDVPVSYCYREFTKELEDSFEEAGSGLSSTYMGRFPSFRIDYILHSASYESVNYKTISEKLSDHKPVIVELSKKTED